MAIGLVIIIIYIIGWISGHGVIYDFNRNIFYNFGLNSILIIGILLFIKDFKKTLKIRKENKLKIEDSTNDTSKNDNSVTWQEHLENNYKITGTRTKMSDIQINNDVSEKTTDDKVKLQKQNSLKSTIVYSLLAISISINILLFTSLILVSNNMNQIKKDYDILEKKNSQMCKWHFHFTENGIVKECNE